MESKVGFLGGMDRDSSLSKRNPNKYYDASNIRVLTDDGVSTGSIINEKGNKLIFKLPENLAGIYTLNIMQTHGAPPDIIFYRDGYANNTVTIYGDTATERYNSIISDATVISDIADGFYNVFIRNNELTVVGLTNLLGVTSPVLTITTSMYPTVLFKIVGLGVMRDWIVVMTMGTGDPGNGQIWKCKYNEITGLINDIGIDNTLVPSKHLVYNGILGFDISYRVGEIISRYQDSTHGKIFFINSKNTMKHINILDPESTALPLSAIDIVPNVIFTQPKIKQVVKGGSLKAGSIQYSYQLFNQGGSETSFAPASGITHLTLDDDYSSTTLDYRGSVAGTNVNKSVKVTVDNIDTSFDYIRLISIYYTSQEAQPEINIIGEKPIPESGSIEFTDNGNPIGVYAVVQYNSTGTRVFIPGTIATKNNYLLAGNIKEEYFDFDEEVPNWDSRAFRWDNINNPSYLGTPHFKADSVISADPTIIPETADCVITRTEQSNIYRYDSNGKLGGEGTNIKYEFVLNQILIDSNLDDKTSSVGIASGSQLWSSRINNQFVNNDSFTSYASPINRSQLVGYFRDEIYRFGITVFDTKGRQSFVKWIGDIKMPQMIDSDATLFYIGTPTYKQDGVDRYDYNTVFEQTITSTNLDGSIITPGIYANVLGVKFTVNNIPEGYTYKIVRVRREEADKVILGQGLMGCTKEADATSVQPYDHANIDVSSGSGTQFLDTTSGYNGGILPGIIPYYQELITFKSPEVLFNNSIKPIHTDVVELVALHSTASYTRKEVDGHVIYVNKLKSLMPISKSVAVVQDGTKIDDTLIVNPDYRYVIQNGGTVSRILNHNRAYKGSVLAIGLESPIIVNDVAYPKKFMILNYSKDPSYIQYGGNEYYNRINNVYISCGNLTPSGITTESIVYGGDTFIGMFEYLNSMEYLGDPVDADERMEVIYIPLESTINTELKHGTSFAKDDADYRLCETVSFGTQVGNANGLIYPANYTDIYQYNSVYSVEPIGKTFTSRPQFFENNQTNDYRVIVSEKHINNQLSDSWTKFYYNNLIEVNSAYGKITKLITFRNRLFFFQDNAFGILGFQDRQLLNDNTGLPLVLGTGGILTNFQYISEKTGSKSKFGVIDTGSYLYFMDLNNRKFMRFTGDTDQCVSDKDNMSSFFRTFLYGDALINDSTSFGEGIHGIFDPVNKRVLYTMMGNETSTFSYNEVLDNFESFYSFKPTIYENTDYGVISINPSNLGECYLHNAGLRGVFYGTAYDSYITHIFAPNPDTKKTFNNLEFNSYVEISDVDSPLQTINSIQLWDSYQNTGNVVLTHPDNLRRRFRTWRYQLPKVNSLRLMDYSLYVKTSFTNSSIVDKYFRLDDITIHYLVPIL